MDVVDRIFELADQRYQEQRQFACDLGIPPSRISEWRLRKSSSYNKRIPQIAEVLGTTVEYLLTGETKKPSVKDDGLSQSELDMVLAYRSASEDDRAVVDAALRKYLPRIAKKKVM